MAQMPEIGGKRYAGNDPAMKQVWNYIYQLEEQLRYAFNHIGSDNLEEGAVTGKHIAAESVTADKISSSAGNELNIQSNKAITLTAKDLKKKGESIAQLRIDTEEIASRVEDTEGNVSTLQQTAKGLESRVQDAEGNVSQLSQTVGGFEQRVADTEGNVSTLQQTAKGLESRVQDAEGNVSQLSQTVGGFEQRVADTEGNVSTLQKTAKGLESKVEDAEGNISSLQQSVDGFSLTVKKAVDDIEIGGRNLLKNSKGDFRVYPRNTGDAGDNFAYYVFDFNPTLGETYTFSADVEITDGNFEKITVYPYPGGTSANVPIPANGRITHAFTVTVDTITQILAYAGIAGSTRGNGVIFRNVKIEKGNKATDWTAAPEDLETRVLNAETAITLNSEEIRLKASKTEVDNLTGRITNAEAQIVTQAGEIQMAVTEVSNISVGGTNLLPGYADERTFSGLLIIPVHDILEEHVEKEICVSFECKASIARGIAVYPAQYSGISIATGLDFIPSATGFTRHSFVTTVYNFGQIEGYSKGDIAFHDPAGDQSITIRKVKIELGNKPTDWSPCPDDPVKTLKNTAMTLNGDGIEMSTTGHFRLYANDGKNSRIKLGGDNSTANFSVDETGKLGAVSGAFANGLTVGGQGVWTRGNIIISSSQPTGVHDVLWLQPLQGVQQISHNFKPENNTSMVHNQQYPFTLTPVSTDVLSNGGSYQYTLEIEVARADDGKGFKDYTFQAVATTSAGSVTLSSGKVSMGSGGNARITMTANSATNLFATAGNVEAKISVTAPETGSTGLYIKRGLDIKLTSKNMAASSAGAQTCTIHYIQ